MIIYLLFLIYSSEVVIAYGYDSGSDQGACGKAFRSSRMHQPPCDLAHQSYCTSAGSLYPWHAVRRFIRENQGLMRRMYGDERHIAVLRAELETNDINDIYYRYNSHDETLRAEFKNRYAKQESIFDNELSKDEDAPRYLHENTKRDDILNTKFVYSEEPNLSVKLGDLKTVPHFRPTSPKPIKKVNLPSPLVNETAQAENSTETSTENEEVSTLADSNTEYTTTEEITETTTLGLEETTTTENSKKETSAAVLFQDAEDKIQNHVNYKVRGVNACPVKEEVVAPFWANNTRGEILALLNLYPFEQYVHWEKCTYEHRQMYCREGCRCEQQYRLHRLLAYDPNNECKGIFSDWFRFPSCCVCKCYNIPTEFRVTSRSPRNKEGSGIKMQQSIPIWFKKRNGRK